MVGEKERCSCSCFLKSESQTRIGDVSAQPKLSEFTFKILILLSTVGREILVRW